MDGLEGDLDRVPRRCWREVRPSVHLFLDESPRAVITSGGGLTALSCVGTPVALLDPATGSICWGNDRFAQMCGRTGTDEDWAGYDPTRGTLTTVLEYSRARSLTCDLYAPLGMLLPGLLDSRLSAEADELARMHCQALCVVSEEEEGIGSLTLPLNRDLLSIQYPTFSVPHDDPDQREIPGANPGIQTGVGQVVALIDATLAYRSDSREDLMDLRRRVLEGRLEEPVGAPEVLAVRGLSHWEDCASLAVMLGVDFSRRGSIDLRPRAPENVAGSRHQ